MRFDTLGICLQGDLGVAGEAIVASHGLKDARDSMSFQEAWCTAAKEDSAQFAAGEPIRPQGQLLHRCVLPGALQVFDA